VPLRDGIRQPDRASNQSRGEFTQIILKILNPGTFNNYTDRTPGCVTKMVESLKWEKLEERRKSNRLCMLYKIKNGLIDIDNHQYIQSNDSRTRGKYRLYQERTSSEAFGNSFFVQFRFNSIQSFLLLPI
jgi:hypothetical protein